MNKPTDSELNKAMAEALGYPDVGYYGPNKPHGMHQDYDRYETADEAHTAFLRHWERWTEADREAIDLCYWKENWGAIVVEEYCIDRNTLPEILAAVEPVKWEFEAEVWHSVVNGDGNVLAWYVLTLPMRDVIMAALKALQKWQAEWDVPE